VDQTSRV